jgi:DNA-binding transcriptional ArsR family regulator
MDTMLRAIADGKRRQILGLVWSGERTAGEIAAEFTISRPAVSQHLAILRDSRLVIVRREGTRRLYRADLAAIAQLRAQLGQFWDEHLVLLKRAAEGKAPRR